MVVKILIVDDEPDVFSVVTQQFENQIAGFEVDFFSAVNGNEAIKKIEQNPDIDVVMTDINMPIMDGLELLSIINKRWPLIRVVVISAYGDMKNIRKAMNQGAYDFIIKPVDLHDLELTAAATISASKEARLKAVEKTNEHEKLIEIEKELEMARNIQSAILPKTFSHFTGEPSFEIYGTMVPARVVGGDFFDFFSLENSLLGMAIADVSGKGVPAALYMSMSRAALRCFASKKLSVLECVKQTNEFLCSRNESCMFITLFYGVLDVESGKLYYCNAGHTPPMILSENGIIQEVGKNQGLALGISEEYPFTENSIALKDKDYFVYYTDGVTEAMDPQGEMFGKERLKESLMRNANKTPKELINNLIAEIQVFAKGAEQSDDITILCLKKVKKEE